MKSIKSRLTLVSMVVLVIFMVLTAIALERAVVKRALQAEEDGLQLMIYSLLAAIDRDASGLGIRVSNDRLFEPSLITRNSGLYALLYDRDNREIWRSDSLTATFPGVEAMAVGDWRFEILEHQARPFFRLGFAIQWPDSREQLQRYDVVVWREAGEYFAQLDRFRQTLWAWLIITTALLLLIMYLVTRWSLQPLKRLGLEIKAIEDQKQSGFEEDYPDEIKPLTENLNILLKREEFQRLRYRNAMDDLAHSLKTPLAVLTGLSDQSEMQTAQLETLREQTDRMNQIVSYQLQKASSVADVRINKPLDLVAIIGKILSALEKVYQEKGMQVDCRLGESILLRMDEGDCLEVVGNLLDNAFKYGRNKVFIRSEVVDEKSMCLRIFDDGDGLSADQLELIVNRGTRLDEATEGQGIGLAVVVDIVESYNIEMQFAASEQGGLEVRLVFQTV